ncbi:MAG: class I SAM-dependent rRNA methyltransferase, partial [Gammaproteobacteria bacterium]|nr:class I SAM-dependent rRNA methyltransferase [Gammaproteobacteria bacterium]
MDAAPLFLKRGEERRLRTGHPWVYSNEIDTSKHPINKFTPGEPVSVRNFRGETLALGYINPNSLISVRLLSRDPEDSIPELVAQRIAGADHERQALGRQSYRMVFGESDGLPGLVIDRYHDVFVVQISTAGMERHRDTVVSTLQSIANPRAIVLRNDSPSRDLEGIERYVEVAFGQVPQRVTVEEGGCEFEVDPTGGQKTGWYFDHHDNRQTFASSVQGARVLDVFSYIGAWGVQAAKAGAEHVTCIDASASAVAQVSYHAELNGVGAAVTAVAEDAFDGLKRLRGEGQQFDVVVVDPPAFIRRKKDRVKGLEAYRRVNGLAM